MTCPTLVCHLFYLLKFKESKELNNIKRRKKSKKKKKTRKRRKKLRGEGERVDTHWGPRARAYIGSSFISVEFTKYSIIK